MASKQRIEQIVRHLADIKLDILPEDLPIRGNAIASGGDAYDRAFEDALIERLESGDDLAWFVARVSVRCSGLESYSYLGGCSYRSIEEFLADGYYADMVSECVSEIADHLIATSELLASIES